MENNYWVVINALADCLEHGMDRNKLTEALFKLDTEIDRCLVGKFTHYELNHLKSVLNRLNYETSTE